MKLLNKDEFLVNEIKFLLIKNRVKEGSKLPSERELAEKFNVQRATVRSAYNILKEEGIIEIRERSGRYMGHPRVVCDLDQIKSFREKLNDIGIETKNKLLAFERIEVDKDLSKKIKLPIGTPVFKITRIRKVVEETKEIPIAIEYAYIPEYMAEKLMKYDLEEESLFQILTRKYHRVLKRQEQVVEIVYANEFEAKALGINQLTPLVKRKGTTYDADGNVIQYLHSVMIKEWIFFEKNNEIIKQKSEEVMHGL